mmetsp:Transcript_37503/g.104247  ORF Transcript_37503/g.104247 Transcript_37503/m.104247 type:complete len:417 (-) Transcript_37503:147-1397(-)
MDRNATVPGEGLAPEYAFKLWNLVIRPPRASYSTSQLGPTEFIVNGVRATRRDVNLRTARGTILACSHFVPRQDRRGKEFHNFPVIVYLHGNSSSRLEAGSLVSTLIAQGISLFCFDAAGCGLSEGDYVSLGWHERDDLAAVLSHLRQSPLCGPIGLWGRSMGAVTALLYVERDPALGAICLDSPFASLRQLAEELAQSDRVAFPVPSWLVTAALAVVRMRVKALADFDIEDLVPLEHARQSYVPAIFLHARQDTFISPSHSRQLYDAYAGDKELVTVDGDHNSERSEQVINHAMGFFKRAFRVGEVPTSIVDEQPALPRNEGQPLRAPRLQVPVQATVPQAPTGHGGGTSPPPGPRLPALLAPHSTLPVPFLKPLGGAGYTTPSVAAMHCPLGRVGAGERACSQPRLARAARGGG